MLNFNKKKYVSFDNLKSFNGLLQSSLKEKIDGYKSEVDTRVQKKFNELSGKVQTDSEVIDARKGEASLRAKIDVIDEDIKNVSSQLEHNANNQLSISVNAVYPPHGFEGIISNGEDMTNKLQKLIDNFNNVVIPSGEYTINGTIKLNKNYKGTLRLLDGAKLIKKSNSDNNDPVIQLCGYGQSLIGENKWSCEIESEKDSPYGVVSLGYDNMHDTKAKSIYYCTIKNINIRGCSISDKIENIGLYMCNPEINGKPSYFHTISSLIIRNVNTGLMLEGWANGNIINDIQLLYVGTGRFFDCGAIKLKGMEGVGYPVENNITNVMQGGMSNGAYTLVFDGKTLGNIISVISEPGGTSENEAIFAKIKGEGHTNNIITCYANTRGGEGWTDEFLANNTVISGNKLYNNSIKTNDLKINNNLHFNSFTSNFVKEFSLQSEGLKEGEVVELINFPLVSSNRNRGVLLTVNYFTYSSKDIGRHSFLTGEAKIEVFQPLSGDATTTLLSATENPNAHTNNPKNLISCEGNKVFLTMPSNGTSTSSGKLNVVINMKGFDFTGYNVGNKLTFL